MKDNKSSLLLVVSLLLLSLSLVLLAIWGYQFFYSNERENISLKKEAPSAASINANTHDSLLDVYSKTINKLDIRIGAAKNTADSLMGNVDDKITEINSLKDEIKVLLKNTVSRESLNSARETARAEQSASTASPSRLRECSNLAVQPIAAVLTK